MTKKYIPVKMINMLFTPEYRHKSGVETWYAEFCEGPYLMPVAQAMGSREEAWNILRKEMEEDTKEIKENCRIRPGWYLEDWGDMILHISLRCYTDDEDGYDSMTYESDWVYAYDVIETVID